ncbi:hypothetical protein P43SY_010970 [Pythium insidiosum]|uniref:Uncharacterized protein n=1 Tax=Pythium insidiosum TaxID=114742 RepID=A0AAD5LHF7_PYTIN|nr:hypothetical protein P43SY_010970 [Pythium insidiosum]
MAERPVGSSREGGSDVAAATSVTFSSSLPPTTALAIAEARHLWSEVERLKLTVQQLQQSERRAHDDQQRLRDYVGSFVTHAQLEAALCTKTTQSNVASLIDRLRSELHDQLDKKADVDVLQAVQSKKLDISVYEASTWDLKKFRTALEQSVHDLFASFAHQIEDKVNTKLSIEDFDRIFNPEANGQKAAIENAATRIARMNEQLENLQEYVNADRQRQHKVADLNVSLLDLTRKHNASRNSIAQLFSTVEAAKERLAGVESDTRKLRDATQTVEARLSELSAQVTTTSTSHLDRITMLRGDVDRLDATSQLVTKTLAQIQQFTQNTLLKSLDARLQQAAERTDQELGDVRAQLQQLRAQTTQQSLRVMDKVMDYAEQQATLDAKVQRLEATLAALRTDLATVKGPLMTAAINLREENVAILEEIRRSQDESREIMIDYKGLLDREQQTVIKLPPGRPASRPLSRPGSSALPASAVQRRRQKQQQSTLAARLADMETPNQSHGPSRPHTSNARMHDSSPRNRARAHTAGPSTTQPTAAPDTSESLALNIEVAPRPHSEAGKRPKRSLLYSVANEPTRPGEHALLPVDQDGMFTLPSVAISTSGDDESGGSCLPWYQLQGPEIDTDPSPDRNMSGSAPVSTC